VVVVIVTETVPADGVRIPDGVRDTSAGVTFTTVMLGLVAVVTVVPFASTNAIVTVVVDVPSAITLVGDAEQDRLIGLPKTEIGALALRLPAVATTEQGWLDELVAKAMNVPTELITPQPPVTDQVASVEPLNCCVQPTGTEAAIGEIARVRGCGTTFWWK
jgi:hypothetical protein